MRMIATIRGVLLLTVLLAASVGSVAQSQPEEPAADEGPESEAPEAGPTLDERLDALLSEVSAYEEHEPQRCLNSRSYRTVKVLNDDYLLFSKGNKHWLNKLKRTCRSLKFNDLPIFESRGSSSLCQNDPFYPSNSMDVQRGLSGGRPTAMHGICFLGSFEEISAEQVALLTELE